MFFNSIQYLVFLPLVLIIYYLTVPRFRWVVLLVSSCFFYMYFIPKYILCLFFLILVDYFSAIKIHNALSQKRKKTYLILSIISNFGLLFYFKYAGFFTEILNVFFIPLFGAELSVTNEILPIGLSFHTFQSVSYVVDVYREKIQPEKHLGIYSTYVLFFPQMVAGPIERFSTLGNELKKSVTFTVSFIKKAVPLIIIGLFYKMVIADNCGEYVNETYQNLKLQNNYNVLIAVFLFCIQIYSDFFGYSLIAQGSAQLFGIKLIDNFSFPFFSTNIVDFWKKWHISLTSWFRDYVYISLGGNRTTTFKYVLNIILIFTLSGLWHGAGFNFILWGFIHSVFYLITVFCLSKFNLKFPLIINYLYTFILVSFIFVFFRSGELKESIQILRGILPHGNQLFKPVSWILLMNIIFIFSLEFFVRKKLNYEGFFIENSFTKNTAILCFLLFGIVTFSGIDNLPFIYFQF